MNNIYYWHEMCKYILMVKSYKGEITMDSSCLPRSYGRKFYSKDNAQGSINELLTYLNDKLEQGKRIDRENIKYLLKYAQYENEENNTYKKKYKKLTIKIKELNKEI
jgi:hypothetical protein